MDMAVVGGWVWGGGFASTFVVSVWGFAGGTGSSRLGEAGWVWGVGGVGGPLAVGISGEGEVVLVDVVVVSVADEHEVVDVGGAFGG